MSKREDYKRFIVFCLASLVVLAQAAVFAWVWYSVYRGQIDEPFWRKGNWVLIAIYGLMFALFAKEIAALLRETYGSKIKVFGTEIPHSVRAKEISAEGKSIFAHDPGGKVAEGYKNLTQEVMKLEKQREKSRAGIGR